MDIRTKVYVTKKMFDNDLVGIGKIKITLALNKPAYVGMWIWESINVSISRWLH